MRDEIQEKLVDFVGGCVCCVVTTGGEHQGNCPLYQKRTVPDLTPFVWTRIRIQKWDDAGNFIKEL